MQRIVLICFGALFALLFVGVGFGIGIGSSSVRLPSGVVAIVETVPQGLGTVTAAELEQEMKQQGFFGGAKQVPKAGDAEYERARDEALSSLVTNVWLQGQAEELGIEVTDREVEERVQGSEEAVSLRRAHYTPKTIDEHVRVQILSEEIMRVLGERAEKPSRAEIKGYYEENREGRSFAEARAGVVAEVEAVKKQEVYSEVDVDFPVEWQARTHCAASFVVEVCAGFPAFSHPSEAPPACYETDPKEAPEACPAPATQRSPVLPGTVRPWRPEGDRRVQRPVPPGGGEEVEGFGE